MIERLFPQDPQSEAIVTVFLALYVLAVIAATSLLHKVMKPRVGDLSSRYYNRKIIHAAGGGVVAVLTPYIYSSPLFPALASFLLAVLLILARRVRMMNWFQVRENAYEVNFVIAWGASVHILWLLTGSAKIAVLPALLISFGDAVTGFVRNALFGRRTKHWAGNVAMAFVALPLGYMYAGEVGLLAGAVATLVERLEFGAIDDNVLITAVSSAVLLLFTL